MNRFKKIVEIGPSGLEPWAEEELLKLSDEVVKFDVIPDNDEEIIRCIGDADGLLVRMLPVINSRILESAPNLRYVGMCCSLYSKESANVDIDYAEKHGITVSGIRDYGDCGVREYVVYQLVRILHGYDYPMWRKRPLELTGLKIGFVGFGASGQMSAAALHAFDAKIAYYARSIKPECEEKGMHFMELNDLLSWSDVVITCLNKNVILLREEQFRALGNGKIMINTSIGPASDTELLKTWAKDTSNILCSDTQGGIGPDAEELMKLPNVICTNASAGMTAQAYDLLSKKVLDNIYAFLK